MSGDIIVPPDLSVEEQAAFIRKEMLARGIDPDTVFPVDVVYSDMKPGTSDGVVTLTLSYAKESS